MEAQHTKHVMYKLGYHFVWCPKYRKRILTGKVAVFVAEEIRRLCEVNGWRVGALNVQEDHVHLLTSCSPICRAFADCACFERSNRPEGVSTFSFRQETALGRCFLGSVLLCRQCWGYERGDCAQIHRIGARINAMHSETFQKAFLQGRSMYFDDREYDIPHVASRMWTLDAVGSVLDEDGKGGYHFDRMAFNGPFDILGFFLGYMSGPILAESPQEHEERMKQVVILPEPTSATGIAL